MRFPLYKFSVAAIITVVFLFLGWMFWNYIVYLAALIRQWKTSLDAKVVPPQPPRKKNKRGQVGIVVALLCAVVTVALLLYMAFHDYHRPITPAPLNTPCEEGCMLGKYDNGTYITPIAHDDLARGRGMRCMQICKVRDDMEGG